MAGLKRAAKTVERHLASRIGTAALLRHTDNFRQNTWLGQPIWQNPLDAWMLQEAIGDGVDYIVECGTHQGGSAYYLGCLFDIVGRGHVATIDTHDAVTVRHPRVTYLTGSSTAAAVVDAVRADMDRHGPAFPLVLLDSDHRKTHVLHELAVYAPLVPVGGWVVVQDGVIDTLRRGGRQRPGPLAAAREFTNTDHRFVIDWQRSGRYLYVNSPGGWLRRIS